MVELAVGGCAAVTGRGADATGVDGAATATGGRCGGAALAAASALRRSRMALRASPGLETFDRLNAGRAGAAGRLAVLRLPFLK